MLLDDDDDCISRTLRRLPLSQICNRPRRSDRQNAYFVAWGERGGDGGAKLSPGRAKSLREFYSHVHCWQLICISASAEEYFFILAI
jgi:hypothetical protein